jgi:CARDB
VTQRIARPFALLAATALMAGLVAAPEAAARARRPDLVVSALSQPPGFTQPGQGLALKDTVRNTGTKESGRSVTRYYLSKNATKGSSDIRLAGQRAVPALSPDKKSTGTAQLTVPNSTPTFVYFVLACADATKKVAEIREANNCRSATGRMLVDGPEEPGNPLTVTSTLGTGEVSEEIDMEAGGTLSTSGADGTLYTLEIPADALLETTKITMTPIDSIAGSSDAFEFDGGLGGAVELEPHGLRLYQPATLTIEPASAPPVDHDPVGFAYDEGGEEFHLYPWNVDESTSTIHFALTHFSGFGMGNGSQLDISTLPEYIPVNTHPEFRNEHSIGELMIQKQNGEITPEHFADAAAEIFIKNFYRHVIPALARALMPNTPESDAWGAFNQCTGWARSVELLGLMDHEHSELKIKLRTLWDFCEKQFPKIAKKQFDQADERCSRQPPVNPPEQVRIMLRWARLSDLMLGGAHAVLGEDYFDKIERCREKFPASVTGTIEYRWTEDGCIPDDSDDGCGTTHDEQSGTIQIAFNKRNPSFCCDWDDAGGNYNASLLKDWAWVEEVSSPDDNICDVTSVADASNTQSTGAGSTVTLDLTFSPSEDDHDAFVNFSDFVEDIQSNRDQSSNCDPDYTYDLPYTGDAFFWSNDCPFREPGVPRTPGLMGTYDPDNKTINLSCSDDRVVDGAQQHIEVTGTLTVTGGL